MTAIIVCTLLLVLGGCEMHSQTHPDSSRCLPGTIHVEVGSQWACAPDTQKAGK